MKAMEIFEKVKTHLLEQNALAMDEELVSCQYRSKEGLKCAVGCLIPDKLYEPIMEGNMVDGLLRDFHSLSPFLLAEDLSYKDGLGLLENLQYMHDNALTLNWPEELDEIQQELQDKLKAIGKA